MSELSLITDRGPGTFYNDTDLNRVGHAVRILADLLAGHGYTAEVEPKTDWQLSYLAFLPGSDAERAMRKYLANIHALRDAYYTLPTTPPMPESMNSLGYEGANDIERVLADLAQIIAWMAGTVRYSNQYYSGEAGGGARVRFTRRRTMAELEQYTMAELEQYKMQEIAYGW